MIGYDVVETSCTSRFDYFSFENEYGASSSAVPRERLGCGVMNIFILVPPVSRLCVM